ncbi:alpha/beta fold hydrolase [Pseudoalteromonas sp. 68 DY56-GL68]|uniref:alpha/beta fold hydrolase n=1 Tax=Pseudoalteromonas sp. 68 DY56-GL68 TaxID=2974919 RepID=UPI00352BCC06
MQPFSFQTGTQTLRGLTFGHDEEAVVALHGWLDNAHSYIPMLENAKLNHTWYCIDFPGHGLSDWRSNDAHYYFIDYIDDVYKFIESLEVSKVHLVGHSMGAMVAGVFASCFPEKVASVNFIEGIGGVTTNSNDVSSQLRKAILNRARVSTKGPRAFESKAHIISARLASGDLEYVQAELLMSRNSYEKAGKWYLTTDPKLKNHSGFRFDEAQCIATIKQIQAPCQLILGEQGFPFVKQNLEAYGKYYKELKIHQIPGGHHCHMQNPALTLEHIHAFIEHYKAS